MCDDSEYTYDMRGYLGQDTHSATGNMKATHTTVRNMTQNVESTGQKVLWTNLFLAHTFS
jgi:hypothetical protein